MPIHHGDCLEVMAAMEPESVDAICTDPPYGLEFMGKEWDRLWSDDQTSGDFARSKGRASGRKGWDNYGPRPTYVAGASAQEWHARWAEAALRVAKPSAYLLAFGGTRTVHRMTVALEDAGWIIRDMLVWAYASGFPKSKASLKPAWEPIVMARKPGPLRDLAIDACRIGTETTATMRHEGEDGTSFPRYGKPPGIYPNEVPGRWPANVILTDPIFDGGVEGVVGGGETTSGSRAGAYDGSGSWSGQYGPVDGQIDGDSGTYSRFFLIPKAARSDREPVLGGQLPEQDAPWMTTLPDPRMDRPQIRNARENVHPTVKPVDLMRHLVRLVTPAGGTVLDPFLGSGTTGLAAEMEGFPWIGIEREAEYVAIAEARLNGTQQGMGLVG